MIIGSNIAKVFVNVNLLTLAVYFNGNLFWDFFLSKIKFMIKIKYNKMKDNISKDALSININSANKTNKILIFLMRNLSPLKHHFYLTLYMVVSNQYHNHFLLKQL